MRSFMLNSVLHHLSSDTEKQGFALIEPHETLCEYIYENIPEERKKDVVYINLADPHLKVGYNMLKKTSPSKRSLVASGILEAIEKFGGSKDWGGKLSYIILNCLVAILDYPKSVRISDVFKMLKVKSFREDVIPHIRNNEVKDFFTKQFKDFNPKFDFLPVYNKFRFLLHDSLRKLFIDNEDSLYLGDIINNSKILLINTAKARIGQDASSLAGSIFISQLASAGFNRMDSANRKLFTIYIDEAQTYTTGGSSSITTLLEELRKMSVSVCMSFQGLTSLSEEVRSSLFSNVPNILCFRTSASDGKILALEMAKHVHPFSYKDFVTLPKYHMILRIMNNGQTHPFTATSIVYEDYVHGGTIPRFR